MTFWKLHSRVQIFGNSYDYPWVLSEEKHEMSQEELLNSIIHAIHESDSFRDVMEIIEPPLLKLLAAERVTVYSKGRSDREIVSTYRSGEELKEIRVPLSPKVSLDMWHCQRRNCLSKTSTTKRNS